MNVRKENAQIRRSSISGVSSVSYDHSVRASYVVHYVIRDTHAISIGDATSRYTSARLLTPTYGRIPTRYAITRIKLYIFYIPVSGLSVAVLRVFMRSPKLFLSPFIFQFPPTKNFLGDMVDTILKVNAACV